MCPIMKATLRMVIVKRRLIIHVSGTIFACDELYKSDDSEDGKPLGMQCHLMNKMGLEEVAPRELTHKLQLSVLEEVRSEVSSFEIELVNLSERFASLITHMDKYRGLQQGRERKLDLQYRRTVAEALDNHLTVVWRDHEHMSQIDERRIRDDAACEEAKRKEKAIQEEKLRQESIKAEGEARLNTSQDAVEDFEEILGMSGSSFDVTKGVQTSGNVMKASQSALELERRRRRIYEELSAKNKALKETANQVYHGRSIGRKFRSISAVVENVSTEAAELVKLMNNPGCPQSIGIVLFAEKVVSNYSKYRLSPGSVFTFSHVIVVVTSKIPAAMEILIAELNKVCIFTVPKHINYSKEAFGTKDAYLKAIGYGETNGEIESDHDYLERLSDYMKLYGALVQTEEKDLQNLHGLTDGWAWLARFLNALPANLYTSKALYSFLEVAGYALHQRYKNQFEKLLRIIAHDFLNALEEGESLKEDESESRSTTLNSVKIVIRNYIESKEYKKEPEGLLATNRLDPSK